MAINELLIVFSLMLIGMVVAALTIIYFLRRLKWL